MEEENAMPAWPETTGEAATCIFDGDDGGWKEEMTLGEDFAVQAI